MLRKAITSLLLIVYLFFTGNIGIFWGENNSISKVSAIATTERWVGNAVDAGDNGFGWANINNTLGDTTGTFSQVTLNLTGTRVGNTLRLTNFDFANAGIPAGSIINGVQVRVEWNGNNAAVVDDLIQLTRDGVTGVGSNLALGTGQTTKGFRTYGGLTNLWGTTWTLDDILSPDFGVLIRYRKTGISTNRNARVYRVGLVIDYTAPVVAPGGVFGSLRVWLKSNEGTSTTTNGASLATWNDQSPNGLNANAITAPIYRNNTSDNLNFYPTVEFNGTNHYMNNTGLGASSQSMFTVIIPNNTIQASLTGQVPFGVECVDGRLSSGTCGLPFGGIALGEFTGALTDEVVAYAVGSAAAYRSVQTGTASYPGGSPMIIHTNENAAGNGIDIYESGVKIDNATANSYQFLTNTNYSLGRSMDNANPFHFGGKIVEVINYAGRLSDTERRRIESYLAYKYGISIGNGTQDYLASNGTTLMWSSTVAGTFTNNIFGIGRDEAQGLRQPQSRGIEVDNILTLQAVGQGTNISPNLTNISDMEFFSVSNNSGGNTWTASNSPANFLVLDRKWRAQEVGDVGNINFDFDVNNANFNVPNLDGGTEYYLVYDSNGNGSLADETPIAMTNMSGNIWRASNINMSHNTLFTLATELEINTTEPVLSVNYSDNSNGVDVQSGQILRYTLEITNTGISATGISTTLPIDSDLGAPYGITSSNCGSFSSIFSSGVLTFSNISISSGGACIIEYYAQVDNLASPGSSISASADVSDANEGGNDPANINLPVLDIISCGVNDVTLSFVTDNWGEDVFWSLVPEGNSCGVGQIASGGNPNLNCGSGGSQSAGANDPYPDNTTIVEGPYSLAVGNQYRLYVVDDFGDGNTATAPHILVSQNSTTTDTFDVTGIGGSFSFIVQQPTVCIDTISPEVTINQAPGQDDPTGVDSATFQVIFNEAINVSTFTSSDITLSGTSGSITSGPTEVSPFNSTTFQFTVTGMTLGDTVTATIPAGGIEDLAGNLNNASSSIDNQVSYDQSDTIPPTISGTNFASGALLPGGSHTIVIDYFDADSGIDTSSDVFELYKWNGSTWGSNIASGNIGTATVTATQASYPTLDLDYGKYLYAFQISDNAGNNSTTGGVLYIDRPLFRVSTGEIDIGNITSFSESFSPTVTLTVETVGAGFEVIMNRKTDLTYNTLAIESFDGTTGYGYRPAPLSGNIQTIASNQVVATESASINTDGDRNIYTYELQLGVIVEALQAAGEYEGNIDFSIRLDY